MNTKELNDVNFDLMNLTAEIEGLKSMVNTIALSVEHLSIHEDADEKFERLTAPYVTIVAALEDVIKKLDDCTDNLDRIELNLRDESKDVA